MAAVLKLIVKVLRDLFYLLRPQFSQTLILSLPTFVSWLSAEQVLGRAY